MSFSIDIPDGVLNRGQHGILVCKDPMFLMAGGYGAGKTVALILKMLQLIQANPGVPGLVVAPTWRLLWAVVHRRYREIMKSLGVNPHYIPRVRDKQHECYLDFGGGSHVFLRSAHNEDSIEGLDVGWTLCDEARLVKRRVKDIIIARRRIKCPLSQSGFVSTPAMGWLSDEFNTGVPGRKLIVAPTIENARNLVDGYIEGLKLSYSPRLIRAILEGIFTILEGAVYESFDPSRNSPSIIDYNFRTPLERVKKTELAIDPGYRKSSIIWLREISPLKWVVFHQMQGENCSMADMVVKINQWNEANNVDIDRVWVDPAADARDQADGINVMRVLKGIRFREGLRIYCLTNPYRSIALGVEKTRVLIGNPAGGQPIRLFFSKEVAHGEFGKGRGIIKSLGSYAYPEVKDGRPVTDIPDKDGVFDHDCDAIRYWAMGKWLSDPRLRRLDSSLSAKKSGAGFRIAA